MTAHQFLHFVPPPPRRRVLREIAVALMNRYRGKQTPLSRTQLLKIPRQSIPCYAGEGSKRREWDSVPVCVEDMEAALESGEFDFSRFQLFDPGCHWLDAVVIASPASHFVDSKGDVLQFQLPTRLGANFPLVPLLDREGTAISSPVRGILTELIRLRTSLVDNSACFQEPSWFQDLRMLVGECVSLIDVTLHQFYYKAKYDPLTSWAFDERNIGQTHGQRLADKLSWINKITGAGFNAPHDERAAFMEVKELRNHLQHFDPPCVCFSLEDVVHWMNLLPLTGRFAWRIRTAIGSPLSTELIKLVLAPDVRFVPSDAAANRAPQAPGAGYASTRWSKAVQ